MPARPTDPLLAKPVRAGSSPAMAGNGAGQGRRGVARDCSLGTGQDRSEWHSSGTAGEGHPHGVVPLAPDWDAPGAPVLRDQGPIDRPGTARPIKASSRTVGYLSVTCDPDTALAHMYIHRRCSSRGSRRSRIRAALRQTVAAAAVMGHRIHRRAVARPRRPWRGFSAVTFASPPRGNPRT
jgi:hypothetical protein